MLLQNRRQAAECYTDHDTSCVLHDLTFKTSSRNVFKCLYRCFILQRP